MKDVNVDDKAGEVEAKSHAPAVSLQDIFPGETYGLKFGKIAVVRKWGAREVTREIPALFARIFSHVLKQESELPIEERMILALQGSSEDVMELVKHTCSLTDADIDLMSADELLGLMRAMVRQNKDFFVQAQGLYQDLAVKDVTAKD